MGAERLPPVALLGYDSNVESRESLGARRTTASMFLLLALICVACKPSWADDAARALKTTPDDAIRIVRNAADQTLVAEDDVARYVIRNGDAVIETRPRLLSYVDDLRSRLDQTDTYWQDVIYGVYCDASARATSGLPVSAQDVYDSAVSSWGQAVANALDGAGWIFEVANLIAAARSDDPEAMQLVIAEIMYCSSGP
jgi:hypothetical protein